MTRHASRAAVALVLTVATVALASPECVRLANSLATGPCSAWHTAAAKVSASVVAADCGTLHAVALTLPSPDDACCAAMRTFVEDGCGCDADVARLAALGGFGPDTPKGGARLATVTRCADPAAGGRMMANKCGGNCMPIVAGGGGGGGLPAAGLPASPLPLAAPAAPLAAAAPAPEYGALGTAPPGRRPAPTAAARSPAAAPAAKAAPAPAPAAAAPAAPAGDEAMVLMPTGGAGAGGAAPGAKPAAPGAPQAGAAAGGAKPAGPGAPGGQLPNLNAMMGIVGPGMISIPVTPGSTAGG